MEFEPDNNTGSQVCQSCLSDSQMREVKLESYRVAIGMFLFAGVGILASNRHGFWWNFPHSMGMGVMVSLIAGAVAGLLMFPKYRVAAITCSPLAAVSGYVALNFYLVGREWVGSTEIVLIQCVAAIPAIVIGNLIRIYCYTPFEKASSEIEDGG